MNCKNVEPLLSLYVGGDLEQEHWRLVAAHLQFCTECNRVADEYATANQLLQRYEPPFFSDKIYAGIRTRVLNDIERKSNASVWPNIFSQLFSALVQPRMRWVTAALLVAISVIALDLSRKPSRHPGNDQQVAVGTAAPAPTAGEAGVLPGNSDEAAGLSSLSRKDHGPVALSRSSRGPRGPIKRQANGGVVATNLAGELDKPSSAPAPLRMEMQTNDRNIRIIWLSGPRPGAGGTDGSKGT
jgi:hypothetical protein